LERTVERWVIGTVHLVAMLGAVSELMSMAIVLELKVGLLVFEKVLGRISQVFVLEVMFGLSVIEW
jgi:uncharacterized YccA/Bax inhibitor family protein